MPKTTEDIKLPYIIKATVVEEKNQQENTEMVNHGIALAELVAYIDGGRVNATHKTYEHDYNSEAICLSITAGTICRNMFEFETIFTGFLFGLPVKFCTNICHQLRIGYGWTHRSGKKSFYCHSKQSQQLFVT